MKTPCRLTLAALLLASAQLGAQTAAPSPTPPATSPEEEPIMLTPFEVKAERDTGYQATETLAGTRIRTNLRDVGAAIQVITKDFMNDIGATDNTTLLQYTTNSEVGGTRSTYAGLGNGTDVNETSTLASPHTNNRVRGLSAADNTRDFFVTDIPWDGFNIDRVEIQRGPNSILFGLGKPAGIINASLRNAEFRDQNQVEWRFGSFGSQRATLDINQNVIPGTLAIRLSGLWDREKFQQDPAFEDDSRLYGAIRYEPKLFKRDDFHTSIRAKYEHGSIDANRPRTVPPNDRLSPWFRATNDPMGGMNRLLVSNPYNAEREDNPPIGGDNRGYTRAADPDYIPWVGGRGTDQQPLYFFDGATGQLQRIYGGFMNNGARNTDGTVRTNNAAIIGRRYAGPFYSLVSMQDFATRARLPGYQYGQYREQSLLDPSVFNFYDNLIDGPNKSEKEDWDAYNITLSQTGWGNRLGVELNFDYQEYDRSNQSFLGWAPTLDIDILSAFQDLQSNPNAGRAFVQGNPGGQSYSSEREYMRGSLFGELRSEDFLDSPFFRKLLGKHRFNGVYSGEKYRSESRTWQLYASSAAFDAYSTVPLAFSDRPPLGVVYLGNSLASSTSASGANLPGINAPIVMNDGALYHFNTTWNSSVAFNAPWTVPSSLADAFNNDATTQVSNPANYVGWNSNFNYDVLRFNDGDNLYRNANKAYRRTKSYAGSWQGYWWDDALVTTVGWRYDTVQGKDRSAPNTGPRSTLVMTDAAYSLPDAWASEFKHHSLSKGAVLHLNRLLGKHDFLPLNLSVSYNASDNFEIAGTRRNMYGDVIGNPTGETKDYGVLLSTKDNKYSLRIVKYEASVKDASTQVGNMNFLGNIIVHGLRWRNVFLYNLNAYTLDTANGSNEWRYNFDPDTNETQDQATARENASIAAWNQIQAWLPAKFYQAWGFTPPSNLNSPTNAEVQPYAPDRPPPGMTMTSDTMSKGYEFEFTANPTRNWRIAVNAAKTDATRTNVGSAETVEFVNFITQMMAGPAGEMRQFSGGPTANTMRINWNGWLGPYTLMKLQEGASASELRRWRYNVVSNYSFRQGMLKGVGVGASYRWQDKVVIGYPVIAAGNSFSFDLSQPYYGPSEDALDLWASYERKLSTKLNWKVQLNIRNAFDKDRLIPVSVQPDGRTWASARIAPGQEIYLTNTFTF
ncbi:MAG: TonB-dependent receptor [Opitutus sp.]|nr:TonB-dependent receptor [Opitutus sp.]